MNQPVPAQQQPWPTYTDVLTPFIEKLEGLPGGFTDPLLRQEMLRHVYAQAAQGYFHLIYQDTEYPDFWPVFNQVFTFGFADPDDSYYMAVVDGDGVYKISGFRGTVRMIGFHIGTTLMMPWGIGLKSANDMTPPAADYDIDDQGTHYGPDGAFEVILSAERPAGYEGDWWKLDQKATYILVRQRAYDWINEVDARIAIERLDRPAMKPRPSKEKIEKQLRQVSEYMENWSCLLLDFGINLRKRGLVNKIAGVEQQGGLSIQQYLMGMFDIEPDEALILETDLPRECRYWMFHICDELLDTIDPLNRQTSINGHQAHLDRDGKFRGVISIQDPGVPNWLDTGGYGRGAIVGRWMYSSDYPQPTIKKVKLADLRRHLPGETPTISAGSRDAALRQRRKAAQLRKRW